MKKGEKKKDVPIGTIRIRAKDIQPLIKTKSSWKKENSFDIENLKIIVKMFKAHKKFKELIDSKDNRFLKGCLLPNKKISGQRINILPNGEKLDRAYSLFAPNLTVHDQKNNIHWDVIFQNPNGKYAYLYTLKKKKKSEKIKYNKVNEFKNYLPKLKKNLLKALKNGELIALPMYTLLKTYIRVGNETYYKTNGHKGLTTLTKKDISLNGKKVIFEFIGKDGVPQKTENKFPETYIIQLNNRIRPLKKEHFVFTDEKGRPLRDVHFEKAFEKYCGEKFYPHIVRSYYATNKVEEFLQKNPCPTKEQIINLYTEIAEKLGHKKFSKKENIWKPHHTVTVAHYIAPELVERVNEIVVKN